MYLVRQNVGASKYETCEDRQAEDCISGRTGGIQPGRGSSVTRKSRGGRAAAPIRRRVPQPEREQGRRRRGAYREYLGRVGARKLRPPPALRIADRGGNQRSHRA